MPKRYPKCRSGKAMTAKSLKQNLTNLKAFAKVKINTI